MSVRHGDETPKAREMPLQHSGNRNLYWHHSVCASGTIEDGRATRASAIPG